MSSSIDGHVLADEQRVIAARGGRHDEGVGQLDGVAVSKVCYCVVECVRVTHLNRTAGARRAGRHCRGGEQRHGKRQRCDDA